MAESLRTVPDIIDSLGITALAREFGHVNVSTVSSWKYRALIPVAYWPTILAFARREGMHLTNDDLVRAHVAENSLPQESSSAPAAPATGTSS